MYNVPFNVVLNDKVAVITGAGGIICGEFAKALAQCGAKVALLDINYDAAKKNADEIGANALAVKCNCLDKQSITEAYEQVIAAFGNDGQRNHDARPYRRKGLFCAGRKRT